MEKILHYFRLITDEDKKHVADDDKSRLERVFPRIAMVVTKQIAAYRYGVPIIDLACTVCESITASTFLSVCTTRRNGCKTTFLGATVQAAKHPQTTADRTDNRDEIEKRIIWITLRDDAEIEGAVERAEWCGTAHGVDKDLISFCGDENDGNRNPCIVNDSLETIMWLIPPLREYDIPTADQAVSRSSQRSRYRRLGSDSGPGELEHLFFRDPQH